MIANVEKRTAVEEELLAILASHNELFDILQIKPQYLSSTERQKILDLMIECYNKKGTLIPSEFICTDKDGKVTANYILYFSELYQKTLITSNYYNEFIALQKQIVDFYKEDIILKLNEQLKNDVINYETFISQINRLQDIDIFIDIKPLTKVELINNISDDKKRINLNNFPKLNEMLELAEGDYLVVGATTGAGKSGLLLNFMNDLMDRYQCIYFNMEMNASTMYQRIISIKSDVPINHLSNPSDYQKKLIDKACSEIEKSKIYIENKATNINAIKSIIKKVKNPNRHTIVFLDHLGLISADKKSLYEQATEVAKQLRQICLEYDCTIISASQLNRSAYQAEEMTLSMLKDSGELENSASKVILLYRDKDEDKNNLEATMNLEIAKNRNGLKGVIKAKYFKTKQIFKEIR